MRGAVALLLLGLWSVPLAGQTPLERARAQRAAGDLAEAAATLEALLAADPADLSVLVLLAETRYWLGDHDAAVTHYERALRQAPEDVGIRLLFGRTLVELSRTARARQVLQPLGIHADAWGAEALFLLGTMDYWAGELTRATHRMQATLALSPAHAGAARMLREIRSATSAWLRIEPAGGHDTQDLTRTGTSARAGFFVTPLLMIDIGAAWQRFAWNDTTATLASADVGVRARWAGARLTLEAGAGAMRATRAEETRATGRASLRADLAAAASVTAAVARAPYVNTTSSLAHALTSDALTLRFALEQTTGWIGEAAARIERFDDDNRMLALWAWLLAPLLSGERGDLRAGWAVGWQDARESRFEVIAEDVAPGGMRRFRGRYIPYYTPQRVIQTGPAAALNLRPASALTLGLNGSWSVHAAEDAPFWFAPDTVPGSPPARGTYRRTFHPLEARASIGVNASPGVALTLDVTHARTAFYEDTRVRTAVLVRFPPGER